MLLLYVLLICLLGTSQIHWSESLSESQGLALLWSDWSDVLSDVNNPSDLLSSIQSHANEIESIVIFTLPDDSSSTLHSIEESMQGNESQVGEEERNYYVFLKGYMKNSNSHANVNIGLEELYSHLAPRHSTYVLECDTPTSLDTLNPYTFAYNQKIDVLVINILNGNLAQQCVNKVMSKVGSKYIAAVATRPNHDEVNVNRAVEVDLEKAGMEFKLASASSKSSSSKNGHRHLLQSSSFSQYSSSPPLNPQYPWSSANQNSIPLINRPGPLYITPAILYGLMIGLFLLSVLYIGITTLADIERPVRFATQVLHISKEY